ncbi:hypothetical protein RB595_007536 [Gaeumannomyces hyphopodioides]
MRGNKEELAHSGDRQAPSPSSYSTGLNSPIKDDLEVQEQRERGGSALPVVTLVALVGLLLSSATGIVFFALGGLQSIIARSNELPSRVVVLIACAIGALYTIIHIWAARTGYRKKEHGSPQMYGNYVHAAGLLLIRLSLPIWITAIATSALAAARIGLDVSGPFRIESSQTVYVNLLLSTTGLISNVGMLCCVEWSMTPFATALISKAEFLRHRGRSPSPAALPPPQPWSPVEPPMDRYRSLNLGDRATGAWPAQDLVASQAAPASLALPTSTLPPGTAISETVAVAMPPIPVTRDQRSPVHMAWRPPSHHGKRSVDERARSHTRAASVVSAAHPHDAPLGEREPKVPDVFVMSHQDWRSIMASHSTPATPTAGSRMARASRPSTSATSRPSTMSQPSEARRPSTSAGPQRAPALAAPAEVFPERNRRKSMASSAAPPAGFGFRGAAMQKPVPATAQVAVGPKAPSPRAMSLRSHPPFGAPLILPELPKIAPPPVPPVLSRPAGGLPAERPRTAPGNASASAGGWGVKRKPMSGQATAVDETASLDVYSTDDDDGSDEDEEDDDDALYPAEETRSVMSRTARRVRKARAKEEALKRSQSVNQNFSRPLHRSKSMASIRR